MWAIENQTHYSAERTFVRDRDGSEIWLVAVRGTFLIQSDGSVQIAEKQEPIARLPEYQGKPSESSLRCDTDLPRTKLGTDVLLNATAYVPRGEKRGEIEVGFRVANLTKTLLVSGDRTWKKTRRGESEPGEPRPFASMPIRYENSFGGSVKGDTPETMKPFADYNPLGRGIDRSEDAPLPNVRYPGTEIGDPSLEKSPAGFGAIASHWMPRRSLAGTYDEKWQKQRQPLLPDDFEEEYFYSAPADQRIEGFLRGGERVDLINLTPSGKLSFVLPKLAIGCRTSIDGGIAHHRSNLHTVLIEPDEQRLIMVWHSALPCHHTLYTLKRTIVFEKQGTESLVA